MNLQGPLCFLKTILRFLRRGRWIDGCEYGLHYEGGNVQVLQCARCGRFSISWRRV